MSVAFNYNYPVLAAIKQLQREIQELRETVESMRSTNTTPGITIVLNSMPPAEEAEGEEAEEEESASQESALSQQSAPF